MPKKIYKIMMIVTLTLLVVGFGIFVIKSKNNQIVGSVKQNKQLQMTTSFYPLYYFATQITKEKADVHNITPAGAEPHAYEPTSRDITKIENSQILIINGNDFEAWAKNINTVLGKNTPTIVNISKNLADQNLIEKDPQTRDPHFWLNPKKLSSIANFAKQNQVEYIFFESLVSPKLADTIAVEVGAKTLVLNPIEGITQEEIENGKTYFTEMYNNLINLKIALKCQ